MAVACGTADKEWGGDKCWALLVPASAGRQLLHWVLPKHFLCRAGHQAASSLALLGSPDENEYCMVQQVAQRCVGVSILGKAQSQLDMALSTAVAVPAWAVCRGLLQPQRPCGSGVCSAL